VNLKPATALSTAVGCKNWVNKGSVRQSVSVMIAPKRRGGRQELRTEYPTQPKSSQTMKNRTVGLFLLAVLV